MKLHKDTHTVIFFFQECGKYWGRTNTSTDWSFVFEVSPRLASVAYVSLTLKRETLRRPKAGL